MKKTIKILRKCKITRKYFGYYYLSDAIDIVRKNPNKVLMVTKDIYPVIAEKYCITEAAVERSIRTVIEKCWHNNKEYVEQVLGYKTAKCPSNMEFIDAVAYYIDQK